MGKITDIQQQAKRSDRVSVYVDGDYSFSLSLWQLSSLRLRIGDELDESRIEELKNSSEAGKLYDKALKWLSIRPRSQWEISDYLKRKTADEKLRQDVYETIRKNGYVNDRDFTHRWIANRRLLKPMSKYRIKQELLKKHVPKEIIDEAMSEDETDDSATVKELILKRRKRYNDEQKLMAYLSRQGYSYGTIKQALEELKSEED